MADSSMRIDQMLTDQTQTQAQRQVGDPFADARAAYEKSQAQPNNLADLLNDMFQMQDPGKQQQQNQSKLFQQAQAPEMNKPPSAQSALFQPASKPQMNDFAESQLPKLLQKMGVNDKGLAMNPLGKIQLIGRLKQKFGDTYNESPDALKALNAFDEHMKQNPQGMESSITKADRTLNAIYGGKA